MRMTELPPEFKKALPVIKKIENAGFEAYFVGGCVRDFILDTAIHDVDIATSAYPSEVKAIFKKTIDVGIAHGTVMVLEQSTPYEITTFRTESTYQDYRRPDSVTFVRSLEEDLKRRDFTINALAMNYTGEVIDLFSGLHDLEQKILKEVGNPNERFNEDALRIMRGLRFSSQLGFCIESNTLQAIVNNRQLLDKISVERIHVEFIKLMLGKYRSQALDIFLSTECFRYCPMLADYEEKLIHFNKLPNIPLENEISVWTLLLYLLDINGASARKFLQNWKCSNEIAKQVEQAIPLLRWRVKKKWTKELIYTSGLSLSLLVEKLLIYFQQEPDLSGTKQIFDDLPIHDLSDLELNGTDLMYYFNKKPGKWLGSLLQELETQVLDGNLLNHKETLLEYAKMNNEK